MAKDDIYAQPVRTFLRSRVLWSWVRTLAVGIATLIGVTYATYRIAIWVSPPYASDGYHRVMPVEPDLFGMAGALCSIGAIVIDRRAQRRKRLAEIASYMDPTPARALRRR